MFFNPKALHAFERLDIFGVPITIRFNQKETHKTYFGASITIIIVTLLTISLINSISDVLNYKNVNYIFQENTVEVPSRFDITPDRFVFAFGIDQNLKHFIDESIYQVEAILSESTKFYNQTAQAYQFVTKDDTFKPVRCTQDHFKVEGAIDYFLTLPYKDLYCFPLDRNLNLEGQYAAQIYRRLRFRIRYCSGSGCSDIDVIKKKLDNISLKIYYVNYAVKITDKENPFRPIGMNNFWQSGFSNMKNINIYFRNSYLESNEGILQEEQKNYHNLIYSFDREQVLTQTDRMMFDVYISLDKNKESQYIRKFQNLSSALSQLGGLFNFLFSFGCIICYPLSRILLQKKLLNQIFSFVNEPHDDNNQNQTEQQIKSNFLGQTNQFNDNTSLQFQKNNYQDIQQGSPMNINYTNNDLLNGQEKHDQVKVQDKNENQDKLASSLLTSQFKQARLTQQMAKKISFNHNNNNMNLSINKKQTHEENEQNNKSCVKDHDKQSQTKRRETTTTNAFKVTESSKTIKVFEIFKGFCSNFGSKSGYQKTNMINYALEKLNSQLDIYKIINKLIELEKLKQLLLNDDQRKLFEFIPQPVINEQEFKNGDNPSQTQHQKFQASILNDDQRSYAEKAKDAQEAYYNIFKSGNRKISKVDQQLLLLIDPKISVQLEMQTKADSTFAINFKKALAQNGRADRYLSQSNQDDFQTNSINIKNNQIDETHNGEVFGHRLNTNCNKESELLAEFVGTTTNND